MGEGGELTGGDETAGGDAGAGAEAAARITGGGAGAVIPGATAAGWVNIGADGAGAAGWGMAGEAGAGTTAGPGADSTERITGAAVGEAAAGDMPKGVGVEEATWEVGLTAGEKVWAVGKGERMTGIDAAAPIPGAAVGISSER